MAKNENLFIALGNRDDFEGVQPDKTKREG